MPAVQGDMSFFGAMVIHCLFIKRCATWFRSWTWRPVLTWLLDMLATKLSVFSLPERDCCLLIDEVQLKEKLEYDKGLKRVMGAIVDQPNPNATGVVLASHALCYMARGIRTNWKQIIAWYPTGNSLSGIKL